ncbi:rpsA, partial [Symbiodinium sp. CCMP2456]
VYVSHVDIERPTVLCAAYGSFASSSSGSMQDRTRFDDVYACQWLEAVVSSDTDAVTSEALLVDVRHPDLEVAQRGIVPIKRLELSMKGGAADIRTDLEASRLFGATGAREHGRFNLRVYKAVHLSELSEDILVASQETTLRVRVKSADVVAGRLFLSTKAIDSQELRAGWIHGSIDEVHKFGLIVRIPSGHGLAYVTEMDHYLEEPQTAFAVGQKVTVRILGEMEEGLLALSMKAPTDEAL